MNLNNVIDDYLNEIKKCISLFETQIGKTSPLRAWHNGVLPQQGKLSDNIEYRFHGIGCLLIFPDYEVDFDFGPDNRIDGFDLWRLTKYVSSRPKKYPEFSDHEKLKKDFQRAIDDGVICISDQQYCNLYFYT